MHSPLFHHLGLRGIGINRPTERLEALSRFHEHGEFTDQIAGMRGDNRGAHESIRALLHMHAREPVLLAIEDGPIDFA